MTIEIKKLIKNDFDAVINMDTGIENDYVIRIFYRLATSDTQGLFGLYEHGQLASIAGYTLFHDTFAMLGRLRTDRNYFSKGYSTQLMNEMCSYLQQFPSIKWIGANTQTHNSSARRVIEKAGMKEVSLHHSLALKRPELLSYAKGDVWNEVTSPDEKLDLLHSIKDNPLHMFPYECYYPLPFDDVLFTLEYLAESAFFLSPDKSRFVILRNDQKGEDYAHVKYFWNDHYKQPGLFDTLLSYWGRHPDLDAVWIDFTQEAFQRVPNLEAYDVQEPWLLYGKTK
ncbi:GNAT family N-acetyltransferase [Thalassobacillus hwangdonensis]|uniref:GNAT family N-acetyltransferase n=1 Tax=Thalassobacillus hwangdonensis TaxID=546108 RepID=A0ABW3L4J0_9BACI